MDELAAKLVGKFLVVDGPDGAGKTTQLGLLRNRLDQMGLRVQVAVDPGTTRIGQKIRSLLLDRDNGEIGPMCETLLFMASRAQLVDELVRPALEEGRVVLCDRFISATIAYQGASGVDVDAIIRIGRIAVRDLLPDLTIVLDIPTDIGFQRIGVRRPRLKKPGAEELEKLGVETRRSPSVPKVLRKQLRLFGDRVERRNSEYHDRVRTFFHKLPDLYPAPVSCIDAAGTPQEVHERICKAVLEWASRNA